MLVESTSTFASSSSELVDASLVVVDDTGRPLKFTSTLPCASSEFICDKVAYFFFDTDCVFGVVLLVAVLAVVLIDDTSDMRLLTRTDDRYEQISTDWFVDKLLLSSSMDVPAVVNVDVVARREGSLL